MYQTEGDSGPPTDAAGHVHGDQIYSRFFVADGVQSGSPAFVDKTSQGLTTHTDAQGNIVVDSSSPGYATYNFCTGQCWYDQGVISPAGHPNMVYVFGSYLYNEDHGVSNARGLLLSRDGGNTFTDLTDAATGNDSHHDGLHPDQHALVTNPNNPLQYWEGDDGGLMRSDGRLVDISSRCDGRNLVEPDYSRCKQLLSAVPGKYVNLNIGLGTLQFQSLSVNPQDPKNIQGGTQDNGTFETSGSAVVWPQTIFGDGGLSGFDPTDKSFRFHTYFNPQVEVNFNNGNPPDWDWIADPFFAQSTGEPGLFYFPIISDPTVHGSLFAGTLHAWRTTDDGGPQAYLDANCNRFTGAFAPGTICGDWAKLGDPSANGRLTCSSASPATPTCPYGSTRSGGNVSWLARGTGDDATLWAATTTGRVLISKNANAAGAASVAFTRLDSLAANSPARAVSSISVDPASPNHAFISYLSYNALSANPGHVFSVTYNPVAGTATWTPLDGTGSGSIGDQPVNG